jgi:hypothetical protein
MKTDQAEKIIKKYDTLDGKKSTLKSTLQEICDYMLPHRATVTTQTEPGQKRMAQIYDGTAIKALQICANGLYGHLTNPSAPWFMLTTKRKDLADQAEVKDWLRDTSERMQDAINTSNFSMMAHEIYTDLPAFGTGVMYLGNILTRRNKGRLLNFKAFDVSRCVIEEDADGEVDTVIRSEHFTVRGCIQAWGNECSEDVRKKYDAGTHEELVEVLHAVYPRADRDPELWDKTNMPWVSLYVERQQKSQLEEGGFEEFPYFVPRWAKQSGHVYGSGPGIDALAEVKMVNEFSKSDIKMHQKRSDPPILAPDEMALYPKRFVPGGVTYYKPGGKPEYMLSPNATQFDLAYENQRRDFIMSLFFADLFTLLAQQPRTKTATEVLELVEERLVLLGPTLGRLQTELFDPLLARVFWMLYRGDEMGSYLAPPPQALIGQSLDILYISKLAMAMRSFETKAAGQALQFVSPLAERDPSIMDNFDLDKIARGVAERFGTPTIFMNPEYKVRELREARAAKQAEMEQMQREQMQADMAAKVGPVLQRPVEEGSIGQAMMNAGGMEAAPVQ